jgi:hypothetical protein
VLAVQPPRSKPRVGQLLYAESRPYRRVRRFSQTQRYPGRCDHYHQHVCSVEKRCAGVSFMMIRAAATMEHLRTSLWTAMRRRRLQSMASGFLLGRTGTWTWFGKRTREAVDLLLHVLIYPRVTSLASHALVLSRISLSQIDSSPRQLVLRCRLNGTIWVAPQAAPFALMASNPSLLVSQT